MSKLVKIHYHDHAEGCKKCGHAREAMDPGQLLFGGPEVIMALHEESCDYGKDILLEFWLRYTDEEYQA